MKIRIYQEEREFIATVYPEGLGFISVSISEKIHPERTFSLRRYLGTHTFDSDEYDEIDEGVCNILDKLLQKEALEKKRVEKWKKFEKRG
jgi:hypothetical protein